MPIAELRRSAISGTIVTGTATALKAFLQVLAIVVLARLLTPEDFGVMAMVFPVIALATIFQQAGLSVAVLQRESISDQERSTIFWINVLAGTLLGALLVAISPLLAEFYGEPRVQMLTAASGAIMILGALTSQHMITFARELSFGRLAVIDVLSLTIGTSLAIATAYLSGSYWAVFLLTFGTSASTCLLAWTLSKWRPGRTAPLRQVRDMVVFGAHITAANLATYLGQNVDKILIGRVLGATPLGLYERAYKVVLLPILFVHMPMFRVLVPMLSQNRQDAERYRRLFILAFQLSLLLTWPGTLILILASSEIIMIVMGEQWSAAAPIFSWLAVATLGQLATGPLTMLFVSQGRSREALVSSVASSFLLALAFAIGLRWGATGVAASFAAAELVRTPIMLWYATRSGPVSLRDLALALAPFLLLAALVILIGTFWTSAVEGSGNPQILISFGVVTAYATALVCLLLNQAGRRFLAELIAAVRSVFGSGSSEPSDRRA